MKKQNASLLDKLGLCNTYKIVAREDGKLVYAHTVYYELDEAEYDNFITEDDEPVDNLFSEKQQRLTIEVLQSSSIDWTNRDFMACANVGMYYDKNVRIPVVPDMFLAMDVKHPKSWREKKNKCYFAWEMGKLPDLVLEIVSNKVGGEESSKKELYAKLGIKYYVVHDPYFYLSKDELKVYHLVRNESYELLTSPHNFMPEINLGIQLWNGLFEQEDSSWHRWCTKNGSNLLTGKERADEEKKRADQEKLRAEQEKLRAEQERVKAKQEKERAEQEKARAEQERVKAEQEKLKAEQEKERAEQEKERAEQEKLRAKQEKERAEQEKLRAEQEKERAEQEKTKTNEAIANAQKERELKEKYKARLEALGLSLDDD